MDALRDAPIGVVVLNWNLPDDTIACVQSLLDDGFSADQIAIVDNGSTDDSLDRFRTAFATPPLLLPSAINRGFAGGNNLGIQQMRQRGFAWIWLLNNDTIVPPGTRAQLHHVIASHPECALISPLIVYHDQPARIWSQGRRYLPGLLLTQEPRRNLAQLPDFMAVDSLTACALLVRADVFARIGLLDEAYFMYGEDGDFCLRATRAGFRLGCWTPARILHKVSRSSGSASPRARRWRAESMARFYRLHGSTMQNAVHLPFTLLRTALISSKDLLRGDAEAARASWQGWWSGWFGALSPAITSLPAVWDDAAVKH